MQHSMVHKQLRTFLINMAITWINQKYGFKLKSEYKVPRGKYKGEIVRKHHIRASKAQLVTEIPDAGEDLQPSFPLLSIKPSQTLDLQSEKSRNSEKANTSSALLESVMGRSESPENRSPSCSLASEANMSSEHEEIAESLSSFFPKGQHRDRELKPQEVEKMNRHKDIVLCGSSSPNFSDRFNVPCELGDRVLFQVHGMEVTQSYSKKTPLVQAKFLGCPMELVVLCIIFPSSVSNKLCTYQQACFKECFLKLSSLNLCSKVEVHEVKLWASNTELHLEAGSFDPITVSLVFPTSPTKSRASFFYVEKLLEVYLPYLPYTELLK
ncbi:hypothetical protein GOP47_0023150 [Adiantum capillus-veneris]|nr:hypothetical protein GOP47_0023150 [Adiantum capillus-veneris]